MGDLQLPPEARNAISLGPIPSSLRREDFKAVDVIQPATNRKALQNGLNFGKKSIARLNWMNPFATKTRSLETDRPSKGSELANGLVKHKNPERNGEVHPVPKINIQKLWPNPEQSLGDSGIVLIGPQRSLQCWQILGEASERTRELQTKVITTLDKYSEDIHRGEEVPRPMGATIFMVGTSRKKARPVLVLSGQPRARKEAMKKIRESKHLDDFRQEHGLRVEMMESNILPIGHFQSASGPLSRSAILGVILPVKLEICYNIGVDVQAGFAAQLYISFDDKLGFRQESKATIGCLLVSDGKYFAWTAGHAFFNIPGLDDDNKSGSVNIEFAFDPEYGYETDGQDPNDLFTRQSRKSQSWSYLYESR